MEEEKNRIYTNLFFRFPVCVVVLRFGGKMGKLQFRLCVLIYDDDNDDETVTIYEFFDAVAS